jgi:mRNA-degrading endonuclease RelE of RelBE toxin-antitoxin system
MYRLKLTPIRNCSTALPKPKKGRAGRISRRRGRDVLALKRQFLSMKRATVYFEEDLHKALKLKAAEVSASVSDLVNEAIREALAEDLGDLQAKKLSGEEKYRIRQGDYRIIYQIQDEIVTVVVVRIAHRREVDKK